MMLFTDEFGLAHISLYSTSLGKVIVMHSTAHDMSPYFPTALPNSAL